MLVAVANRNNKKRRKSKKKKREQRTTAATTNSNNNTHKKKKKKRREGVERSKGEGERRGGQSSEDHTYEIQSLLGISFAV